MDVSPCCNKDMEKIKLSVYKCPGCGKEWQRTFDPDLNKWGWKEFK